MIEKNWSLDPGSLPSDKMISHAKGLEKEGVLAFGVLESLAGNVKKKIEDFYISLPDFTLRGYNIMPRGVCGYQDMLPVITCAASLAYHGYLGSLDRMMLFDVDLTSVPAEHLASLISTVTRRVTIAKVSGCSLVTILDHVRGSWLDLYQSLDMDSEETRALVRAMERRVKRLVLLGGVTLDIRVLMEYSGQGKCEKWSGYMEQLRTWASSMGWGVDFTDKNVQLFRI